MELSTYIAKDRRLYNGAPCSDLRKEQEHERRLCDALLDICKNATCTYFPMEDCYMIFIDHSPLTNNFHSLKQDALIEAIKFLGDGYA